MARNSLFSIVRRLTRLESCSLVKHLFMCEVQGELVRNLECSGHSSHKVTHAHAPQSAFRFLTHSGFAIKSFSELLLACCT